MMKIPSLTIQDFNLFQWHFFVFVDIFEFSVTQAETPWKTIWPAPMSCCGLDVLQEHLKAIWSELTRDSQMNEVDFKATRCLEIRNGREAVNDTPGQIVTTSAEVTLNDGGLIRESTQNSLNSRLGIILICPDTPILGTNQCKSMGNIA